MKILRKIISILTEVEKWGAIISLGVMFLVGALEIVSRNLFKKSFLWSQELIIVFLVWEVFLAAAYVYNTGNLISVDFLYAHLKPAGKKVTEVIIDAIMIVVLYVTTYYGWQYQLVQGKFLTNALHLPNNIHSIPLVICSVSILLRIIEKYASKLTREGKNDEH